MHPDDLHEVPVGVRSAARDDLGDVSLCRVWRVCFHEKVACVFDGDGVFGHFARPFEAAILPRRAWLAAFSFSSNAGGGSGRSWRGYFARNTSNRSPAALAATFGSGSVT